MAKQLSEGEKHILLNQLAMMRLFTAITPPEYHAQQMRLCADCGRTEAVLEMEGIKCGDSR